MSTDAPNAIGSRAAASPRDGRKGPIFIAGPDRSGTTLIYALLASHPGISMVRRTNMWRYFHRRYGDLGEPENFERCLGDMVRYRRMRHLAPDAERIRAEFAEGEPSYGRLFTLFHEHHAERAGKSRWGDKSLHTEHYVDRVLEEFPDARVIHMVRDARDRYCSVKKRYGRNLSRVGAATARWLLSARAAIDNTARHPERCLLLRYEDLAREPEVTMRRVCAFIDEPFAPEMLGMGGAPEHRDAGGNSSFGDVEPGRISTRAIGRYRSVLAPRDIAFIEFTAGPELRALGYEPASIGLSLRERAGFFGWYLPINLARMAAWTAATTRTLRRGERIPPSRLEGAPS